MSAVMINFLKLQNYNDKISTGGNFELIMSNGKEDVYTELMREPWEPTGMFTLLPSSQATCLWIEEQTLANIPVRSDIAAKARHTAQKQVIQQASDYQRFQSRKKLPKQFR